MRILFMPRMLGIAPRSIQRPAPNEPGILFGSSRMSGERTRGGHELDEVDEVTMNRTRIGPGERASRRHGSIREIRQIRVPLVPTHPGH